MLVLVVDVGGTHFVHSLYDVKLRSLSPNAPISQIEVSGDQAVDPLEALSNIARQYREVCGDSLCGMSIAVPSPFDHHAGVSRMEHKLHSLYGVDLKKVLAKEVGVHTHAMLFVNDADAFLLGALATSREPRARTIGMTLGTGVGSAFAVQGELVSEGSGVPHEGEIWNLPFGSGIIEDAISTRALVKSYEERAGQTTSVLAIAQAARRGDSHALHVLHDFGTRLASLLDQISESFRAEQVLLGGGICGAADIFLPVTLSAIRTSALVSVVEDRTIAPLIGAGAAWTKKLGPSMDTEALEIYL